MRHLCHLPGIKTFVSAVKIPAGFPFFLVKTADPFPVFFLVPGKGRPRSCIFPQIIIHRQGIPEQIPFIWKSFSQKPEQIFIPGQAAVSHVPKPHLFIPFSQLLKHPGRPGEKTFHLLYGIGKLAAVIVNFHHFLYPL